MRRSAWVACAIALAGATTAALPVATTLHASNAQVPQWIAVESQPITRFRIGSDQQRFGELQFAGGLAMQAPDGPFGGLSALAFTRGQSQFIGVTDQGYGFEGTLERDRDNRPTGIGHFAMAPLIGQNGRRYAEKTEADAEGLTLDGDEIIISFERNHRIGRYVRSDDGRWHMTEEMPPPVPLYELRTNRGFEAVAKAPAASVLAGSLVGVSEYSLDKARNIMAFVTGTDGSSFEFSIRKRDDFSITDADFLPDGDLIVLERHFTPRAGVAMRLRRIDDADIIPGATVDGSILLDADLRFQIDNMEGLAITEDPDGTPRLTLISDDNHSLFQRNLLIEFRLLSGQSPVAGG